MLRGRQARKKEGERIRGVLSAEQTHTSRSLNNMLDRYPVGGPLVLITVGAVLLLLSNKLDNIWIKILLTILAGPPLVYGMLLLLVEVLRAIFSPIAALLESAFAPYSDPAIDELEALYNNRAMGYEAGKEKMAHTLVQRWAVSEEEARDIVDRLEAEGEIVYLPKGVWRVGPQDD